MGNDAHSPGQVRITMAEFRRLALGRMVELLRDVADREDQRAANFVKRTPAPLERYWTTLELKVEAHNWWEAVATKYPPLAGFLSSAAPVLDRLESADSFMSCFLMSRFYNWR